MKDICEKLERGEISARQAIAQMQAAGLDAGAARELAFISLGGSDLVETGDDGRERYLPSGRLVRDVEAEMAR